MRTLLDVMTYISTHEGYFNESHLGADGLVDINCHGWCGDTPLHVAAWGDDAEAVEILLIAGADPNALGEMDETPLHVAIRQENLPCIALLIQYGARTDIRSEFDETPMEMAAPLGDKYVTALTRSST